LYSQNSLEKFYPLYLVLRQWIMCGEVSYAVGVPLQRYILILRFLEMIFAQVSACKRGCNIELCVHNPKLCCVTVRKQARCTVEDINCRHISMRLPIPLLPIPVWDNNQFSKNSFFNFVFGYPNDHLICLDCTSDTRHI